MPLFTFIVEYEGGTYISQQNGADPFEAFSSWRASIVLKETLGGASLEVFEALSEEEREGMGPLKGIHNVWCITGLSDDDLVLVNIVQTEA